MTVEDIKKETVGSNGFILYYIKEEDGTCSAIPNKVAEYVLEQDKQVKKWKANWESRKALLDKVQGQLNESQKQVDYEIKMREDCIKVRIGLNRKVTALQKQVEKLKNKLLKAKMMG